MLSKFKQLLAKSGLAEWDRYYSIYRGFVSDVDDPENMGRLKLKVPQIYGDKEFNYWAPSKGLYAGDGIGSYFLPNVGDGVWVEFEEGDTKHPVWSYGTWYQNQAPEGASPKVKILQTTSGHRIKLDDENGEVIINDSNGNELVLNSTGVSIVSNKTSLSDLDGSNEAAALGETTKDKIEEALDLLNDGLTEMSSLIILVSGPSGTVSPVSVAKIAIIQVKIALAKPLLIEMLSQKVTLS